VSVRALLGSDPLVTISVSGRHTSKVSSVSVHGSRGTAELKDSLDDAIAIRTPAGSRSIPIDTEYPLYRELREFVGYLDGGPRPRCDLTDAGEVTQALLGLRRAGGLT
jgi:predicted dehydrogenase